MAYQVETEFVPDAQAVTGVYLTREDGVISLGRPYEDQALISLPGQTPQEVSVPMRTIEDCLTEELRRIDPDEIYAGHQRRLGSDSSLKSVEPVATAALE